MNMAPSEPPQVTLDMNTLLDLLNILPKPFRGTEKLEERTR